MITTRARRTLLALVFAATAVACGGGESTITPPVGNDPTGTVPPVATTIAISRSSVQFTRVGQTESIIAEVRDQKGAVMSGANVVWSSSNAQVATVSSSGVIAAVSTGNAVVTATSGAANASLTVTVTQTVASMVLTPSSITLPSVGASQQLIAMVRDAAGTTIEGASVAWTISPASVARVSPSGAVTALAAGSATVTATVQNVSASASVVVQGNSPPTSCTTRPEFAEYLIDPSLVKVITQIGVIGGGNTEIVGRSYVFPVDGMDGVRMPLRAPTSLRVVAAKHYLPPGAPTSGYVPDWSLVLDTGCDVTIELFHVKDVAASIKAVADTTISNSSAWQPLPTSVSFAAGEVFGWYQRGLNSVAFDVIVHAMSRERLPVSGFARRQFPHRGPSQKTATTVILCRSYLASTTRYMWGTPDPATIFASIGQTRRGRIR